MTKKNPLIWTLIIGPLIALIRLIVASLRRPWGGQVGRASHKQHPPAHSHTPRSREMPEPALPLWVEKGWRRNGNAYTGYYRTGGRRWCGRIEERYPGYYVAYIWNPPLQELARHPYHLNFQHHGGDGRYLIHFCRMPLSLDHAIISIETVLEEALGVRS